MLVAMLLAACSGQAPAEQEPSAQGPTTPQPTSGGYVEVAPSDVEECVQDGDVTLAIEGRDLEALSYGDGEVGVLLAHGLGQGPCDWDAFGRVLAEAGLTVLAPQLGSNDPVADLQLGEDWLLEHGVERIALVGASAGAAHAIVAAVTLEPAPVALVALSPPTSYGGSDALAAIGDVSVPTLLAAAEGDGSFAADADALGEAQPVADVEIVDGGAHGTLLADDETIAPLALALLESA